MRPADDSSALGVGQMRSTDSLLLTCGVGQMTFGDELFGVDGSCDSLSMSCFVEACDKTITSGLASEAFDDDVDDDVDDDDDDDDDDDVDAAVDAEALLPE